jgi:hypothetical protein
VAGGIAAGAIVALGVAGCYALALPPHLARMRDEDRARLGPIEMRDGVDQQEAQVISEVYFSTYIGACGGALEPKWMDGEWTSQVALGILGEHLDGEICVDARTGGVSWRGGPRFANFASFRSAVVDGFAFRHWDQLELAPGIAGALLALSRYFDGEP